MLYHFSVDDILDHLKERIQDVGPLESVRVIRRKDGAKWAEGNDFAVAMTMHCSCGYEIEQSEQRRKKEKKGEIIITETNN